jgi:hypothetical protein
MMARPVKNWRVSERPDAGDGGRASRPATEGCIRGGKAMTEEASRAVQNQAFIARYGVTPSEASHDLLLRMIEDMFAEGLVTEVEPFPETDKEFSKLLDVLRPLDANALREKLVISGWLLEPFGPDQMRCQECMYFLVHKRWCDLPELNLPAKADWWCRLWRI